MAFEGKHPRRSKIVIDNKIREQVSRFNYPGCDVSYNYDADLQIKLNKFQYMSGTIKHTLTNKTRKKYTTKILQSYGCTNTSIWM
jgi:hypothetical protein